MYKPPNKVRFTKEGFENLQKEYADLVAERPDAVEHLKKSRELGDLSENGYYKASRAKLSFLDRRIREVTFLLKQAMIMDPAVSKDTVNIGCRVTLSSGKVEVIYEVVGDTEAEPSKGKISLLSPIGRAIQGMKQGDEVIINAPSGELTYTIRKIE